MALTPNEQFHSLVEKSKNILILLPQNPAGDAIGAGRALYFYLKNKNKKTSLIYNSPDSEVENTFSFLPKPKDVSDNIVGARDFILSFNTKYNKIIDVKTEHLDNEVKIYITPERGSIDPRDFSFIPARFKYDLVISLDSPDKESLGKIYEENPDIFYEVPVINIDHHNNNDNFGQINLVEITASSTCEIVTNILNKENEKNITEDIAKCLLTGIIDSTESFQNQKTTPRSLQDAAQLIDKGADQQEIIRHLYKTHPLQVLKLWGRVMAKLKWDEDLKLIWSTVSIEDFVQSRSKPTDIPLILNKLKNNYSSGKLFLVLYHETPESIKGVIKFQRNDVSKKVKEELGEGEGKTVLNTYEFNLNNSNMAEAEKEIIAKLKQKLKQQ